MIAVFLVDDHEIVRRGVRATLEADPVLTVVGEAGTAAQALARIPALTPDVAVLDVRLPDGNGVELCRDLRSALPELRCLMLTSFSDDDAILDAVVAGASGYLIKDLKTARLVEAVKSVASGRSLLDDRATEAVMRKLRNDAQGDTGPLSDLTDRERELLELIGDGLTNRQIGEQLFLAEKTVKNYVSRLLSKLGMHRRTQAAAFAVRHRRDQP